MDELSPRLQSLVDATVTVESPDAEDRARVRRALAARIGAAAGAAALVGTTVVAPRAAPMLAHARWLLWATGGAAMATTVWLFAALGGGVTASSVAPPEPQRAASAPATSAASPTASVVASASAAPSASAASTSATSANPNAAAGPLAAAAPGTAAAPAKPASLDEELRVLREAQQAQRSGDHAGALAALAVYQRRFPAGSLRHEAELARMLSQCALGQSAGVAAAKAYLERSGETPFAPRLRRACSL